MVQDSGSGSGANVRWRGVEPEAQEECGAGDEGKDPVGEACSHCNELRSVQGTSKLWKRLCVHQPTPAVIGWATRAPSGRRVVG